MITNTKKDLVSKALEQFSEFIEQKVKFGVSNEEINEIIQFAA